MRHDGPRTHDTEAHARHKTADRRHGSPYAPLPSPSRFSAEGGEVEKRATPSSSPPKKLPPRLSLQRCSSAKNNDAGTHKVAPNSKADNNKGPGKLAWKERGA